VDELHAPKSVSVLLQIQGLHLISYFSYWQLHFISCWKHIWALHSEWVPMFVTVLSIPLNHKRQEPVVL
jgi:hypothetical protein